MKRDRVRNWREYDRSLIARGDLTVWLSPDLARHAPAGSGKRGRLPVFSDAAIQCALTLKVLFQLPLRAAQGLVGSLIRLAGLGWSVPHFSTLSRRQQALTVVIPYRARGEPLHLVVDSSGLKVLGEGKWKVRRHGADRRRIWRKVHLAVDADSHEIRAVEMTDHWHGDGEILPDPLAQVPQGEQIASVGGDGAYDTRTAYAAAAVRNADLLVPPRRNGKPWKTPTRGACERNETLRAVRHFGRRLWKRWSGYHRRSLAETAMSRIKRLGERLAAHDPARQVAEVQIRCAILNTYNRLGMPNTVAVA
ncbi:IS5 family transposase [Roseomonas harenae]|uniref:IS5 family transposase n=1 Tax=Muricoccus harenae TaxID=2692566 RepID=UPI001F2546A3|nr:IS5 family transposase [Roseomonas harenae]